MYDEILLPTDGSTGTAHVALQAIDLAEQYGATVHVLHVIDADVRARLSTLSASEAELDRRGRQAVERLERMTKAHGVPVESRLREGDPADEILAHADEIGADLIVLGTHGRSGVKRRLIGSVAERVVRHAKTPVMSVRLPDTDVTVDKKRAGRLAEEAIEEAGYDGTVTGLTKQVSVWVAEADTESGSLVVYVDPVTQRTSVVER